uniref:Uncharacterized protein n=1 Tax=Rhizophora mucronata TaxID=61149 RepID=A0A2P2QBY1_RHIMU
MQVIGYTTKNPLQFCFAYKLLFCLQVGFMSQWQIPEGKLKMKSK